MIATKHVLTGFALTVVCAMLTGCSDTVSDRDIEMADLAEVRSSVSKPDAIRLLDPRTAGEFAAGHIPTALNIPLTEISDRKDDIDRRLARYKGVIVYGEDPSSGVARATAKRLMRSGHKNIRMFGGGLAEWRTAGLKLEGTAAAPSPTATPAAAPQQPAAAPESGFGKPPAGASPTPK